MKSKMQSRACFWGKKKKQNKTNNEILTETKYLKTDHQQLEIMESALEGSIFFKQNINISLAGFQTPLWKADGSLDSSTVYIKTNHESKRKRT